MGRRRKLKVIVNGKQYLVEVGDLSQSPIEVKVNGRSYQVGIEAGEGEGETPITSPDLEARLAERTLPAATGGSSVNAVTAPMPGNIVNILVNTGDAVSKDEVLCTLEAMKMQNAIRSPRDGVIAEVGVTSGQAVGYGDILFTFQ